MKLVEIYGAGEWLKATRNGRVNVPGEPKSLRATIKELDLVTHKDGDEQRVLIFEGDDIPKLGLNQTNWKSIAAFSGKDDDDDWIGVEIEMFAVPEEMSKTGYAIRVREPEGAAPAKAAPAPKSDAEPEMGKAAAKKLADKLEAEGLTIRELRDYLKAIGKQAVIIACDPPSWPKSWMINIKAFLDNPSAIPGQELDLEDIPF